jgi:triphosphoribosyl-dephospho-CoA synthase
MSARVALRPHAVDGASIARLAVRALHAELVCAPKPGLVDPLDRGSHADMHAGSFVRSLFALRGYYRDIAVAGAGAVEFCALEELGRAAEVRMLHATGGRNTHRGAIFTLGLLAAAAGALAAEGRAPRGRALGERVRVQWGAAIRAAAAYAPASHGRRVASRFGAGGARAEAAAGFPHVFGVGLPALRAARAAGLDPRRAALQCLVSLMAELPDTNLLHRGGREGLAFAQCAARAFLADGGAAGDDWRARALALRRAFVARRLSPGGSADLLAATLFVGGVQRPDGG